MPLCPAARHSPLFTPGAQTPPAPDSLPPAPPTLPDLLPPTHTFFFQTLFNPNKTVVKMFLVTYDFQDMPAHHMTFLRHRIFLVPVGEDEGAGAVPSDPACAHPPRRVLCYLMHLR